MLRFLLLIFTWVKILQWAVTHSAKSHQLTGSLVNLKHRPVGVGSSGPTNHMSDDDVIPLAYTPTKVNDCLNLPQVLAKTSMSFIACVESLKERLSALDPCLGALSKLCNFRCWSLLLGQKRVARAFGSSKRRLIRQQTRSACCCRPS